jgi:hypothetical protein
MSGSPGALCFTCGQPISDPPRFNHLTNGRPCPACRDRLLASLPSLLPGESEPVEQVERDPDEEPAEAPLLERAPAPGPGPRREDDQAPSP